AEMNAAGVPAGASRSPVVEQLVVFRGGSALGGKVRAGATTVRVGRRRCAVGAATALATLIHARPGRVGIEDYGSCSRRAADAGGLYVRSIRSERGRGQSGWVYKVGHKLATAGAGDPAGPFGRGRLRPRQRVTWFFCLHSGGCQRTLALRATALPGGIASVRVRGYDDGGKGIPVAGATVSAGGVAALTDDSGIAQLRLPSGRYTVRAAKPGLVRSFGERLDVRR
ncbi:MAG: carboxypeptidase-like regulatory domain-containing protein, partial [Actinomycetota bacterium]|nr:carboxypeptidase-like regulatory domain-containing protein [Actinomycetota bacterium]